MSETSPKPPSGRDTLARHDIAENFERAKHGGNWMVICAFLIAILWLAGVAFAAIGLVGLPELTNLKPSLLVAGGIASLVPALLIIMSGYMARTNRRSAAANAMIMEATERLLAPARESGTEGIMFAEQMKQAASEIDHAMAHALSAMKAMGGEIGDERLRLESVAYTASDNARDLTQRLAAERQALEGLAKDLKTQIIEMNDAIPRQAQLMVSAAKQAGEEVSHADAALESRLVAMQSAGQSLSQKLNDLDALAKDAATRTETLTFAVSRVEEKLDQSRRTVDAAVRAGEMAAAAAMTTGDSLKDAVSSALDGARNANHEINQSTRAAAEEAALALARLREAGEQAAAAVKVAGNAARAETDMVERRLSQVGGALHTAVTPDAAPTHRNGSAVNGHAVNGSALNGVNGHVAPKPEVPVADPPVVTIAQPELSARPDPAPAPRPDAARSRVDDELFDAPVAPPVMNGKDRLLELGSSIDPNDPNPLMLRRRFDDDQPPAPEPETPRRRASDLVPESTSVINAPKRDVSSASSTQWRDIISDLHQEDRADAAPRDREEVADEIIARLQSTGIQLPEAFRPRAKRKIAEAARKGEKQRRTAIIEQANRQVERVNSRLRNDIELMDLAREFMELEGEDALNALEHTHKTSRNASSRLAAYLLIDAAI